MSKIKIKNFGPVKEGFGEAWIDLKKVTLFIGNQGSGKSTVAKLISTFTWIEKALTRGDYDSKHFERKSKLRKQYLSYHRIENYFTSSGKRDITEIEYRGDAYHFKYEKGNFTIKEAKNGSYPLPQIMYVPAERNFIANVKKVRALKLTSDSLVDFVTEFDNAKNEMKGLMRLPINHVDVEYDKLNDTVNLKAKDYKLKLVNYISIAIQADYLKKKINGNKNSIALMDKLEKIISGKSLVSASDFAVYQLDENNGTINKLPNPEGIPSDNNYLNQSLRHGNEMFDTLLEIEQEL